MKKLTTLLLVAALALTALTGCFGRGNAQPVKDDGEITVFAPDSMKDALTEAALSYTNVDKNPQNKAVSILLHFETEEELKKMLDGGSYCDLFLYSGELQLAAISTEQILKGPGANGEDALYSVSLITNSDRQEVAKAFVEYLKGADAQQALSGYGFTNEL